MSNWWTEVTRTLAMEFSDIPDASELTVICTRLLVAAFLGGLLGYEREHHGKAAGLRTHMLVSMGAALFVLAPLLAGSEHDAMSRIIQGIVAGVGFLGAGTILKGNGDEEQVRGLTTAAGLWLTAAIGVAVGLGRESTAVVSTLLALLIFALMPKLADALLGGRKRDAAQGDD